MGLLAATALSAVLAGSAHGAGNSARLSASRARARSPRLLATNEIAAQMAVDEINAAGGVNGKKLKIMSFDTAGKPEQAVVGAAQARRRRQGDGDHRAVQLGRMPRRVPGGERAGVVMMSMASSAPKLAEPFTYGLRNTSDEGYMFQRVMKTLKDKKYPDRDRRDRLCHRRRHLQDHGRDRAAEHHEGGRHRVKG